MRFGEKLRAQKLHHNMWTSHLGDENRNQNFPRAQLKKGKIQNKMPVSDRKSNSIWLAIWPIKTSDEPIRKRFNFW